jgi:hypothetical protein
MTGPRTTAWIGLIALAVAAFPAKAVGSGTEFYVSVNGKDSYPGTRDRPFATLERARTAVRDAIRTSLEPITVYLREGTYFLSEPLVLEPEDSGTERAPVVYRAFGDEQPIVSGGAKLDLNWQPFRDSIMRAEVPKEIRGIDQLFVNGECQHMARYPDFDPEARFLGGTSGDAISPQRVGRWSNPVGAYLHALHESMWGSKHYRIVGVEEDGRLKLQGGWQENRGGGFDPFFRGGYHKRYLFVENIFEELDAPGEWFFDQPNQTLYLKSLPGVELPDAEIIGAGLTELLLLKGSMDRPIRHITVHGITFRHTSRVFMESYERLLRGDWSIARLAAIRFEGAEDCAVRGCTFEDLGGNGVFISRYNRRVNVIGSRFTRLGESAVCLVGDVAAVRSPAISYSQTLPQDEIDLAPGPKTPNYPARCRVHNNLMHRLGTVGKQTAGVFISMSEEITVSHNTIYNVPRAAICINDGCWGGHIIEFNDAFNTVRETGDHGPFNSWGRDRYWKTSYNPGRDIEPFAKERSLLDNWKATHIRNNRFSHPGGHSWGIDLDDGSSNYYVYSNLCLGMGVKLREGFYRRVENNIIVEGFGGFHVWFPGCDDVIARNIFVSDKPYQFIRANPNYAKQFDYNLFYSPAGKPMITGLGRPMTIEQWQAKGLDTHSVVTDPMFVAPQNGDYRVRAESPALKLGFKNFPMNKFGVLKPAFQLEASKAPRKFRPAPTDIE